MLLSRLGLICAACLLAGCGSTPPPNVTFEPTPTVSSQPSPAASSSGTASPGATSPDTTPDQSAPPTAAATPTPESPTGTPFVADREYTSDDGQLTLLVPEDAIPDNVGLSAFARGQRDLPLELIGLEVRSAFYEIGPEALEFAAPVRMRRDVRLKDIDVDLAAEGVPILVMAMRSPSAQWEWLTSQHLDLAGRTVAVTGEAMGTGLLFAFGGQTFATFEWSEPSLVVPVGSPFTLNVALSYPEGSDDPPLLGELSAIAADGVVEAVSTSASDGQAASATFRCLAVGEEPVGARFAVTNIDARSVLFGQLGLGPAATEATITQTVTCTDEPVATDDPDASPSPGASLPSL